MQNKNNILFIFFFALCSYGIAQENTEKVNPYLSSEIYFVYPHYFTKYKDQFNYGFGGAISENFSPFKITTGFFYNTKKYFELFESTSSIDKITYSLNYFNVPVLIGFPLIKDAIKKNQLLITTGIIFNIPNNCNSITYYKNNKPSTINDSPVAYKTGSSFRLAFQFNRKLNDFFIIYAGVFGDYKFQLDHLEFNNSSPQWHSPYSEDRLLVGINIGIEWIYKR